MESQSASVPPKKQRLFSYRAWIMILTMAIIATVSHPIPGAGPDYMQDSSLEVS
jgi:hypothetical protein